MYDSFSYLIVHAAVTSVVTVLTPRIMVSGIFTILAILHIKYSVAESECSGKGALLKLGGFTIFPGPLMHN